MAVFSKEKMIERLRREGREKEITPEAERIMSDLDGCAANPSCWLRQVYNEPVLWVEGKNGTREYVNEADCT